MSTIRVAIVGVGNCASSLVQGVHYYKNAADDAERLLMSLIGPLKAEHASEDTDDVEWRSFDN